MITATDPVVLLAQAIDYTCTALATVEGAPLDLPTPCRGWTLGALLDHMADGIDAFTEASNGMITVAPVPATGVTLVDLRGRACALLAAWRAAPTPAVRIAELELSSDVLLHAAALEISVHGWDVAAATTGRAAPLPEQLALALMPAAHLLVHDTDRAGRFNAPLPVAPDAAVGVRLLAMLGRHSSASTSAKRR